MACNCHALPVHSGILLQDFTVQTFVVAGREWRSCIRFVPAFSERMRESGLGFERRAVGTGTDRLFRIVKSGWSRVPECGSWKRLRRRFYKCIDDTVRRAEKMGGQQDTGVARSFPMPVGSPAQ